MALTLHTQLFNAFLGSQQGVARALLPEIHSPSGSKNIYVDKIGRVRRIAGHTALSTTPLGGTTAGVTDPAPPTYLTGLASLRTITNFGTTVINRALIGGVYDYSDGSSIWSSVDGGVTWENESGLIGIGVVLTPPDFAQYGNTAYIANANGGLSLSNYAATLSAGAVTVAVIANTQSPTPTAASTGTGTLNGTYKWKLVSIHGTTGVRKAGSVTSNVLTLSNTQAALTWTADADTDQGGYELYRTTGTGNVFYFVTYIDTRTTAAYTDNAADTDIFQNRALIEHGDIPPAAYFVEEHKSRLWWFTASRAYWSDPGSPTSVYAENYIAFDDPDSVGAELTGGVGYFNDSLVVGSDQSIWTVSGSGAFIGRITDWTKKRSNCRTGWVSHRSVVRVPVGARYVDAEGSPQQTTVPTLAYFTPLGDIRLFNGSGDIVISLPVKDDAASFNYSGRRWIHALHDIEHSQMIWFIGDASAGTLSLGSGNGAGLPTRALVWNYQWGVWSVWEAQKFASSLRMDTTTDASVLIAGGAYPGQTAKVFTLQEGTTFHGTPFQATWVTKPLSGVDEQGFPLIAPTKRWRWLDVVTEMDADTQTEVEWFNGQETDAAAQGSRTLTAEATFQPLVSADGDTLVSAGGDTLGVVKPIQMVKIRLTDPSGDYLHSPSVRIRVQDDGSGGDWSLEALTLAYQTFPDTKRRLDDQL